MSSFGSLNTALSGLLAHRRVLDVIGHNIANVGTVGYSRQRVELTGLGGSTVPAMFSTPSASNGGVSVSDVTRIRDEFLERRTVREHATGARLDIEATVLLRIEATIPEPSDVGLAAQLGDFYAAWDDLANNPGDSAGRIAVLQQASTVASTMHRIASDLRELRDAALGESTMLVRQINTIAGRIAELNGAVRRADAAGLDAFGLEDERDRLILQLGQLAGVETRTREDGSIDVTLGGSTLVRGDFARELEVVEPGALSTYPGTGFNEVQVRWKEDGFPVAVVEGRLGGLLNIANEHVPHTLDDLDRVAASLVDTVNALHTTGQGLDPLNDVNLSFWDPGGTTAATIAISADVLGQPSRIAAAAAGSGALDVSIAQAIASLAEAQGGTIDAYQDLIGRLAVETQGASRRAAIQAEVINQADDARLSVSGVNLDEELTNLISTQRAYEASARVLTAIDGVLDTLINRTGVVGR
jgi:flagellar hook-associated protein 1 FlgK